MARITRQIDQVKLVMDVSTAQEVFAKRQRLGEDVIGYAHTIKTRALARLGELLKQLPKAGGPGIAGPGRGKTGARAEPVSDRATLADLGISRKVASVAQQLATLPATTREAIAQRETTTTIGLEHELFRLLGEPVALAEAGPKIRAGRPHRGRLGNSVPVWHRVSHQQATNGSSASAKDVPGKSIPQLAAAGGDGRGAGEHGRASRRLDLA